MANGSQMNMPLTLAAGAAVIGAILAAGYFMQTPDVPAPVPNAAAPTVAAPTITAPITDLLTPTMDVVRVEPDGSATVAGQAEPLARVSLRIDGTEIIAANADGAGGYASLFTVPPSAQARILTVAATGANGTEVLGLDQVVLAPTQTTVALADPAAPQPAAPEPAAPEETPIAAPAATPLAALKITPQGVQVLQTAQPAITDNIVIDSITYAGGVVQVGGRGAATQTVRLYVNDVIGGSAPIAANGSWSADLSNIEPGVYTLRADQLDADGKVTSRYETPFKRESLEVLAAAPPQTPVAVTVQPGLTLWAIAEQTFGSGTMYIQVFEANKDKIRDPDLIFPGQVFTIPSAE